MRKWYGSFENRIEENKMFCDKIEVGTGMTEYSYSDRQAYEVVEVIDQRHVKVRRYDHIADGEPMTNNWKLVSNEENAIIELAKRGNYWYFVKTATVEMLDDKDFETRLWLAMNGFDANVLRSKGIQKKYKRANVSFGKAEYHYDYEF